MGVEVSRRRRRFEVTADGSGMTARAGTGLLAALADELGLTAALSAAVGTCRSWVVHDPGKVVRDLVVMLADGGDALRHLGVLDGQAELFGAVASAATANRTLVALPKTSWSSSAWRPRMWPGVSGCGRPAACPRRSRRSWRGGMVTGWSAWTWTPR